MTSHLLHTVQVRLRQKLSDIPGAVTSFFTGKAAEKDPAIVKLEELKVREGRGEAGFRQGVRGPEFRAGEEGGQRREWRSTRPRLPTCSATPPPPNHP